MLFNSLHFLIFFPVVVLIYFLIPPKYRYLWLLAASYYFYMCWNAKYALLLLFSTAVTYLSGYMMEHIREKEQQTEKQIKKMKVCVAASFILNLGVLFWFKYFDFAVENINYILAKFNITLTPSFDIILPVGISFFTFQALSYTMDVYRGEIKAEKNFLKYALFVSFFPQLVAGPIERSKNLLKQLNEEHRFNAENVWDGLYLMLWGYFLKLVLADRLAIFVDNVYGNPQNYPGIFLVVGTILFAFQLYCDFFGYSTIAMGVAKIMGFQLMDNFKAPYFSKSIAEFWRRWHISLSSWFKDYLYIPLGGNQRGISRKYFNLLVVFLVSGLWHGASWNFVIWGGLNAVYQIIGSMTKPMRKKVADVLMIQEDSAGRRIAQTLITFVLFDFTLIFFRADSFSSAKTVIKSILTTFNPWILFNNEVSVTVMGRKSFEIMLISLMILLVADFFKYKGVSIRAKLQEQDFWFQAIVIVGAVWFIATVGIWGPAYTETSFIYFQF